LPAVGSLTCGVSSDRAYTSVVQLQLTAKNLNSDHLFSIITFRRFEATRQIRQMEMRANEERKKKLALTEGSTFVDYHLRVLAMTTDVIRATYEECIKSGMDGYVSKPFDEEQLYQTVSKLVVGMTDSVV
jgi:CheY-like chemotaxis protein